MTLTYIVHYGEIALKGRNRLQFENTLINNIRKSLEDLGEPDVDRYHSYLIVKLAEAAPAKDVEARLQRVFGIAYFAPVVTAPWDIEAIGDTAVEMAEGIITPETTFRIETTRGDKRFPVKSFEVDRIVGTRVVEATHAPVDLTHPDVTLSIQIYEDAAYLFIRQISGPNGLPLGSSGRVLSLFSGGIDSPVAAHLMMKRGCRPDFMHFHLLANEQQIRQSKIVRMARQVMAPHRTSASLFMVSSAPFEASMATIQARETTVVFRRFIMRVANVIAQKQRATALVTGESVGQVASQTLQNINVIARASKLPILRPLVGMNKQEIIAYAKDLNTYKISIEPYRDPCSIHAKNPATWAKLEDVLAVEEKADIDALIEETLTDHVDVLRIRFER
jgi:thiamine biosynthesis protein ThiI